MLATLLLFGAFLGILLSPLWLLLQLRALRHWHGWWRMVAVIPAAAVAGHAAFILARVLHDPTSHDLWPFELGMTLGAALVIISVVTMARKGRGRAARSSMRRRNLRQP